MPRDVEPQGEPIVQTIVCPYADCDGELNPRLHAAVMATWAGHGDRPES
jgi:hypothetical protein